jgi:hypothetical protein
MDCPAGTYSQVEAATNANVCSTCSAGAYSSTARASTCTTCPGGTYATVAGASSSMVWQIAQPGRTRVLLSRVRASTALRASTKPRPAPDSARIARPERTRARLRRVCVDCNSVTYSNTDMTACVSCPSGKTSLTKSKSETQCFELDCPGYSSTSSCPQKCPVNSVGPLNGCTMSMTTSNPASSCNNMITLQYSTNNNNWLVRRSERSITSCFTSYFSQCYASTCNPSTCNPKPNLIKGVFKANSELQFNNENGFTLRQFNEGLYGKLIEMMDVNGVTSKFNIPMRTSGLTIVTVVKFRSNSYDTIFAYTLNGGYDYSIVLGRQQSDVVSFRFTGVSQLGLKSCFIGLRDVPMDEWVTIIARVDKYVSSMPYVSLHMITADGTTYAQTAKICPNPRDYSNSIWAENCCDWNYDTGMFNDRVSTCPARFVGTMFYKPEAQLLNADIAGLVVNPQFMSLSEASSLAQAFKYGNNLITPQCACDVGYYLDVTSMSCFICPVNTYKDTTGDNPCLACPYGTSTNGMFGASVCKYKCEIGFYMSQGVCLDCGIGNYVQFGVTEDKCLVCQVGKYSNVSGSTACADCQVGSYSYVSGATSASVCTECYAGMYVNTTSSECITCPTGKYSNGPANTCRACLGNTTSISGSTSVSTVLVQKPIHITSMMMALQD